MALLAGPTGAIHLKRSLKVLLFNKSLAGPTGALTLNRFLSRCKDRYYFIKFQGIRILFFSFSPQSTSNSNLFCIFALGSGRNPD